MFKKGQVWCNNFSGNLYLVVRVPKKHFCEVLCIAGSYRGNGGNLGSAAAETSYTLIGNNYQERPTIKQEKGYTRRLMFTLGADNKALRKRVTELHSIIAASAQAPEALPEQRGCRKEDC